MKATREAAEPIRGRILDVAATAFATRGFAEANLREIAEALGFSKAALYYHFRSKHDLARAIIEPMKHDVEAVMARAEAAGSVDAAALFGDIFDVYLHHQRVFAVIMRDASILRALDMERWSTDWIERTQCLLVGPAPTTEDMVRALVAIGGLTRTIFLAATLPPREVRAAAVAAACAALGRNQTT